MKNWPFLLLLGLPTVLAAFETVFREEYPVWQSPTVEIVHADTAAPRVNADEFCRALLRSQPALGRAQCRIGGEWERDTLANQYLAWVGKNLDPRLGAENLIARQPNVADRLRKMDDTYLLLVSRRSDTTWLLLYTGSRPEPVALGYQREKGFDALRLAEQLGQTWLSASPQRRLSNQEKVAAAIEPDASFGETPTLDTWIGLGGGWSQARIPLTPYSWYKGKLNERVRYYRNTSDSLSGWNFLEDESPLLTVRAGFTWHGFIGGELFAVRTTHRMKIDENDSIYQELDHWDFTRYEMGLTVHATLRKKLSPRWELQPHAFIGFHYSMLREDIAAKSGYTESDQYRNRIRFEPFYKGAIFGIGNRLLWNGSIALESRMGISNRGRSLDREPSEDAAPEPTTIAGATLDCFISASLEYHWRRRN